RRQGRGEVLLRKGVDRVRDQGSRRRSSRERSAVVSSAPHDSRTRSTGASHWTSNRWLGQVTEYRRWATARGAAGRAGRGGSGCAESAFFLSFSSSERTALAIAAATASVEAAGLSCPDAFSASAFGASGFPGSVVA